ncbi:MAG TPA: ribosome maturation factor RimM [Candidatus Binataceae bacterium]|jgi:16S rRNA processing protein RimM|nr:ribosome maturation factor RimM [Candidatus Binataceae bacterium]
MATLRRRAPRLNGARTAPAARSGAPPARAAAAPGDAVADGFVRLGRVAAPHGLHGALRVRTDDPASTTLATLKRLYLETAEGRREFRLGRATSLGAGQFRVVLEGVADIDAAAALKGCAVMAPLADLPPLGEGEFYYFQLLGAEAMLTDGRRLGAIAEIFSAGANDVWVVRDGAREVLVPVIADVVRGIDVGARRVTIEPVPGLLD